MLTVTARLMLSVLWIGTAMPAGVGLTADVLYTFDGDESLGPYADALDYDGGQDAGWWWEGSPVIDRDHPIFGNRSLRTTGSSPLEVGLASDLGSEVTFSVHLRHVEPGVSTIVSNWTGQPVDGAMFIALDPASKYAHDNIFLRFHHWRQTAQGLQGLELAIPPIADWSRDDAVHQIAITYRHGAVTAYFDGVMLGEVRSSVPEFDHLDLRPARHALLFGGAPSSHPFPLVGTADDVLILSRALTGQEVAGLCRQGAVASGLVRANLARHASARESAPLLSDAEIRALTTSAAGGSPSGDSEWTLEAARRQWHPMIRCVQHVGVPGYPWQTAVLWDGSLVCGPFWRLEGAVAPLGDNLLHLCVAFGQPPRFLDRTGTDTRDITRSLDGGRLPIPTIESRDGSLVWQETVFAHLLDRTPEEGMLPHPHDLLVTHMCWRVRNSGLTAQTGRLWLFPSDTSHVRFGYKCAVDEQLGAALPHRFDNGLGLMEDRVRYAIPSPRKGVVQQHEDAPAPSDAAGSLARALEWRVELAPGEQAELYVIVPYGSVDRSVGERLLALDRPPLLSGIRAFWQSMLYRAGQITTPDPFVNDYLVAVAGQMLQQVAFRHYPPPGMWMYKTSPNHYENLWPCNEAKALPTFDLRGLRDVNRKALQSFVDMSTDDVLGLDRSHMGTGSRLAGEGYAKVKGFLGNFREWTANPLLISHGLGMWALAAHYRVTRDRAWLGEGAGSPLQTMLDAFDWVSVQRRRTMREEDGRKVAHWGLLPAASAHDWLAGSTIFNDAFCLYGMAEVVRVLDEIDHPRAAEMRTEFPHDPLVDQALAFMEAGIPGGSLPLMGPPASPIIGEASFADVVDPRAERHYLWRHYVEWETMWPIGGQLFLARDDLPRFFEWLFHNLAIVIHHDWRVGVESLDGVPSCAPGDGERWQLIRRMFVNETGGWDGGPQDLFLLQAIPRCWLRPNDRLCVRDMGTYFGGKVQLDVHVAADANSIQVDAELALDVQPAETRMRLRSGDGRPLISATINGQAVAVQPHDIITLPSECRGKYSIVGRFQ